MVNTSSLRSDPMYLDDQSLSVRTSQIMSSPDSFAHYFGRVLRHFASGAAPWARDNVLFACLMGFTPLIVAYVRDPKHPIDWELARTALWLYLASFIIYAGVQL